MSNSTTKAVDKVKMLLSLSLHILNLIRILFLTTIIQEMENDQVASEGSGVIYRKDKDYAYLVTNTRYQWCKKLISVLLMGRLW